MQKLDFLARLYEVRSGIEVELLHVFCLQFGKAQAWSQRDSNGRVR